MPIVWDRTGAADVCDDNPTASKSKATDPSVSNMPDNLDLADYCPEDDGYYPVEDDDHDSNRALSEIGTGLSTKAPMHSARAFLRDQCSSGGSTTVRFWCDQYWRWNGRVYVKLPGPELEAMVLRWLEPRIEDVKPRHATELCKCLNALLLIPSDFRAPAFTDSDNSGERRDIIAFHNGLANIEDLLHGDNVSLRPHTPQWFSMSVLPFDFDPTASCPQWESFLRQVLVDEDSIDLLQRWFGLLLTCDTSYQKLLLMVGPPRAGKGTVARIMRHILGPDNVSTPTLGSLGGEFGLWPLLEKSVALLADAHLSRKADAARVLETIKSIVGEDTVVVNRKCLAQLDNVRLSIRFVVTVNELPHFSDASGALSARLCILPFPQSFFNKEDRSLGDRLQAEAAGIYNWALDGLRHLRQQRRFNVPKSAAEMQENFRRLCSPVFAFVDDCCELGEGLSVTVDVLYTEYRSWAKTNGHAEASKAVFGEHLRNAFPRIQRKRRRVNDATTRAYCYEGIGLRTSRAD